MGIPGKSALMKSENTPGQNVVVGKLAIGNKMITMSYTKFVTVDYMYVRIPVKNDELFPVSFFAL